MYDKDKERWLPALPRQQKGNFICDIARVVGQQPRAVMGGANAGTPHLLGRQHPVQRRTAALLLPAMKKMCAGITLSGAQRTGRTREAASCAA
jgi:hypothetical protein